MAWHDRVCINDQAIAMGSSKLDLEELFVSIMAGAIILGFMIVLLFWIIPLLLKI